MKNTTHAMNNTATTDDIVPAVLPTAEDISDDIREKEYRAAMRGAGAPASILRDSGWDVPRDVPDDVILTPVER